MKYFDSHCHLHDQRIAGDLLSILSRARNKGLQYMVSCATMEDNFEKTAQLSVEYPGILPCFGIHPWFVDTLSGQWKQTLEEYLTRIPSGIGETGLDFTDKKANKELQIEVLEHHLKLAKTMALPVNIHIRKGWDIFIHMLKKMGNLSAPGIIHSYSGSADMVPFFEKMGLYISFSGSITNPKAKKGVAALKAVSQNRFVMETDAPDIYPYFPASSESPKKRADRINEPGNLPMIAKTASKRKGLDEDFFCENAYHNSLQVFKAVLKRREKYQPDLKMDD